MPKNTFYQAFDEIETLLEQVDKPLRLKLHGAILRLVKEFEPPLDPQANPYEDLRDRSRIVTQETSTPKAIEQSARELTSKRDSSENE